MVRWRLKKLSARVLTRWLLLLMVVSLCGYAAIWLTFTRPMTQFEVLVPISSAPTTPCLVHALGTAFGPGRVITLRDQRPTGAMVQHHTCFIRGKGSPMLAYELTVRHGQRLLAVSDEWRSIDRNTAECARETGLEIRRAIETFAVECDPGLIGRWDSRCELSGAYASEQFCPDPQPTNFSEGGALPRNVDAQ